MGRARITSHVRFADERSPRGERSEGNNKSDRRERSGAAVRGGTPLGSLAAWVLRSQDAKLGSGNARTQRLHLPQRYSAADGLPNTSLRKMSVAGVLIACNLYS